MAEARELRTPLPQDPARASQSWTPGSELSTLRGALLADPRGTEKEEEFPPQSAVPLGTLGYGDLSRATSVLLTHVSHGSAGEEPHEVPFSFDVKEIPPRLDSCLSHRAQPEFGEKKLLLSALAPLLGLLPTFVIMLMFMGVVDGLAHYPLDTTTSLDSGWCLCWYWSAIAALVLSCVVIGRRRFRGSVLSYPAGRCLYLLPVLGLCLPLCILFNSLLVLLGGQREDGMANTYGESLRRQASAMVLGPVAAATFWSLRTRASSSSEKEEGRVAVVAGEDIGEGDRLLGLRQHQDISKRVQELRLRTTNFVAFQKGADAKAWRLLPERDTWVPARLTSSLHLFVWETGAELGSLHKCFAGAPKSCLYRFRYLGYIAAQIVLVVIVESVSSPLHSVFKINNQDAPCLSPVPNITKCGIPCYTSLSSYQYLNMSDSGSVSCRAFPDAVAFGNRVESLFLSFTLAVILLTTWLLWSLGNAFKKLGEAVQVFSWCSDEAPDVRQVAFLQHMLHIESALWKDTGLHEKYHLRWLPLVPSEASIEELWQRRREHLYPLDRHVAETSRATRGRSASRPRSSSASVSSSHSSPSHQLPDQEAARPFLPDWTWWFRYRSALLEELGWVYWRAWLVLIGCTINWMVFVLGIFLGAATTEWKTMLAQGAQILVAATLTFGAPVALVILLGSWVNENMKASLDTMEGFACSARDMQYLEWAKQHQSHSKLTLFQWTMDLNMILTAVASVLGSVAIVVLKSQ